MDKFDALTNNELRDELKSRGLGNFPVTDTTRNALVKKLRNAVNGTTAKPVKNRRETINMVVAKRPSPDKSEIDVDANKVKPTKIGNNRRATIGAGSIALQPVVILNGVTDEEKAKPVTVRSKSPSRPKSPSRRTIAPESISYLADASDDDLMAAAAEEAEKKVAVARKPRSSRSPSLTKSSVVTTSYKHTIEPLFELDDDVIIVNDDNSDAEFSSSMLEKVRKPVTPTTKISAPADNRRKTLHVGPSISTNYANIKPIENPVHDSASAYRRRVTSYASSPIPAPQTPTIASGDDVLQRVETPFLSNFTRRLAQLKAEPLPGTDLGGSSSGSYSTPKSKTTDYMPDYRYYGGAGSGGRTNDRYRSISSDMKLQKSNAALSKWEQKLRWPLIIVVTLFLGIIVYVFFFSNY